MTHGRVARTRPGRAWRSRLPAGSRCMAPTEPYSRFQGRPPVRPTGPAAATTRPPARVSCAVIRPTSGIPGWRPCRRFSRGGTNTAPGGTSVPLGRLMPIPSTGRMAIRERRAPLGEPQRPRPNSWKTAGTPPPHPSAIASAIGGLPYGDSYSYLPSFSCTTRATTSRLSPWRSISSRASRTGASSSSFV